MNVILKLAIVAAAAMSMSACCECDKPKFNAKEYAERKTERLDKIVDLTDAQEKEVYAVYLAQGKEIQKNIKTLKKECGDVKCPDGKKAECKKAECEKPCAKKAECKKAECDKPCAKKAECKKAECDKPCAKKAECNKPCAKKAECKKAECDKAKCDKPCAKKAECKKAECDKAKCDKPCAKKAECDKAKCDKPCAKKAECKKAECKDGCKHNHIAKGKHHRRPEMLSRESRKANRDLIRGILTPEQGEKLKEHYAKRHQCAPNAKQCVPTPKTDCKEVK